MPQKQKLVTLVLVILSSDFPIIQAPMAGGPSTPALAAAVNAAGGYGCIAGGYLSPKQLNETISATQSLTDRPFGVNLFVPSAPGNSDAITQYGKTLMSESERLHTPLGEPLWEDDAYGEKLDLIKRSNIDLVSFTFGCPTELLVEQLHTASTKVVVTVTSVREASAATAVGADALAVQGTEAGGHQGTFIDLSANEKPLQALFADIRDATDLPLIAAGGLMNGNDVATALNAGAIAVQLGTAFLLASEAGTSATYQHALSDQTFTETMLTRAYTGRFARGLVNRFAINHSADAPSGYPEIHHMTRPLRAAATRAGDASVPNLWAGTGWKSIVAAPAAKIIERIVREAAPLI